MKRISLISCLLVLTGIYSVALAQTSAVPRLMAAPMVFYDEGGNLLADGEYTVQVTLLDQYAGVIYAEEQVVGIYDGVGTLAIGAGFVPDTDLGQPAGGLDADMFAGNDGISVQIRIKGQQIIQQSTLLASQPYAFVSALALKVDADAVTSTAIRDGTIVADDLDPAFLDELRTVVAVGADGEILTAESVVVPDTAGLNNSGAGDVMGALRDLDSAIESLRDIDLEQSLDNHAAEITGVHGVTGNMVGTNDAQTLSNKTIDATNSIDGDAIDTGIVGESVIDIVIARDSELDQALANHATTVTGVHGVTGNIVGTDDAQTLSNKSVDATNSISGNAVDTGTIAESVIDAAIARDAELAFANITGVAADGQIPSAITRDSELAFSNMSGVVADGQIPAAITRDSELAFSNMSGVVADAQIPATIARDSDVGSAYLSLGGGTISGDLNLGGNDINSVGTVDGVDLAALNAMVSGLDAAVNSLDGRVDALESDSIEDAEIPAPVKPFAYGTMSRKSGGTCTGYNIDNDCTFTTDAGDSDYALMITWVQGGSACGGWGGDGACFVSSKNSTGFAVSCYCSGGSSFNPQIDFVVFKQ